MEKLTKGSKNFVAKDFEAHRNLFESLKEGQQPHTLFIACADSRVVPSMVTQTLPGELFIARNVANMVPPYEKAADFPATVSAIEYAVQVLKVKTIVICGHSNCGGCAALMGNPEKLNDLPQTKKWLELAKGVKEKLQGKLSEKTPEVQGKITEQTNVLEQMGHLKTYPYVQERVEKGDLEILGWHYSIHSGEVTQYNLDTEEFEKLN